MSEGNRSIQIETGGITIHVEGPDSLQALENAAKRILEGLREPSGRIPMGFQSGSSLITERSPEEFG